MRTITVFAFLSLLSLASSESFADTPAESAGHQFTTIEKLGDDKELILHWGKSGAYYEPFKLDYRVQGKFVKDFSVAGSMILNGKYMLGAFVGDCAITECWKIRVIDFEKQTELEPILVKKYFEFTYQYVANWVGELLELKAAFPGRDYEVVVCDVRAGECKRTIEHQDIPETDEIEWQSNKVRISRDEEVVLHWEGKRDSEYYLSQLDYFRGGVFKKSFDVIGELNFNEEYSLGVFGSHCETRCGKISIIDFNKLELDTIKLPEEFEFFFAVEWEQDNFTIKAEAYDGGPVTTFACDFRERRCVPKAGPEKLE